MPHRTWIEVSRTALLHNVKEFLSLVGENVTLMAVVKANAYGHGIVEVARALATSTANSISHIANGSDHKPLAISYKPIWFGVDSLDEALALRAAGITQPILTLGYVPLDRLHEAVAHDIRLTVYNRETIKTLGKLMIDDLRLMNKSKILNLKSKIHLKIETGTNRQGLLPEAALELCKLIQQYPHLKLEGMSSHFANIEDTTDHTFAMLQLQRFNEAFTFLSRHVPLAISHKLMRHMGATAATILMPATHFDMVRVGIGLYGLWPSRETLVARKAAGVPLLSKERLGEVSPHLKPVLSWKTRIAQIKKIRAGESVGYGLSERVAQDATIAVLPVGYYDGYDRKLASIGNVLVGGSRCKIMGRISMNMCMVDITHVPSPKIEDEVVLIGEQSSQGLTMHREPCERITVEELAAKINTINYEVVARINPLLPRVVV